MTIVVEFLPFNRFTRRLKRQNFLTRLKSFVFDTEYFMIPKNPLSLILLISKYSLHYKRMQQAVVLQKILSGDITFSHSVCVYNTGLFEMIVGVLTTCHTQYTWDRSICIFFLFNRTTLQVFVTYLTGVPYVHPLWFYKHQHDNLKCIVNDKLLKPRQSFLLMFVESQRVHI